MAKVIWNQEEPRIEIEPPKRPKKATGTRFASILGLNRWQTPFQAWCAITKTWEEPFTDNIYTKAGKTIEPLVSQYLKDMYFGAENVILPTDIYGADPFKTTWGDFFKDVDVLGGMWDCLLYEDGKPVAVIEQKTSKRAEDWEEESPLYYAYQGALYAYLMGLDDVYMVITILQESDYANPQDFGPSASNTTVEHFKISERFPNFEEEVMSVLAWWDNHVKTGISPYYDEKKDADALKALRTNFIPPSDMDIKQHLKSAESLLARISKIKAEIKEEEKQLKEHEEAIKAYMQNQFREGDNLVELSGRQFVFMLSKSPKTTINAQQMKKDGVYNKYAVTTDSYRLTKAEIKDAG